MSSFAKLSRPVPHRAFARRRLFGILDRAARRPVVWICGPPGAGKSTAAASWLVRRRRAHVWYQTDRGDADLGTFFHYLGRAVERPGRGRPPPLPAFTPEYALGAPTFARRFFRELCDGVGRPFALVFDNFNDVPPDAPLVGILPDALDEIPPGVCAVFVSREEPPPALARLRANGRMAVIGPYALRVTAVEAEGIARVRGGARLPRREIARLNALVGGWAAGLVLMLGGPAGGRRGAEIASGAPQVVFDYLASEVLERLGPDARRVLLETAILPGVTGAMARRLTAVTSAPEILADLARRGYFTHRHDVREEWYEYHPLFRRLLLRRGEEEIPARRLGEVRRAGAALLREQGQLEPAFELLVRAEAWDDATALVLSAAPDLLRQGRGAVVAGWIGRLPDAVVRARGWLLYWRALSRLADGPGAARETLDEVLHVFERDGDAAGAYRAFAAAVETYQVEWGELATLDRWLDRFHRVKRRFGELPDRDAEAGARSAVLFIQNWRAPDHPALADADRRAADLLERTNDPATRIRIARELIVYECYFGSVRRAEDLCRLLDLDARSTRADPLTTLIFRSLEASVAWWAGRADESAARLRAVFELARTSGIHGFDFMLHAQGIWASLLRSELAVASEHLARLRGVVGPGHALRACFLHHAAGMLERHLGHADRAAAEGRAAAAAADRSGCPLAQCFSRITHALALSELGEATPALATLAEARRLAERARSGMLRFSCAGAEALHHLRGGAEAPALAALRSALALARAHGIGAHAWLTPEEHARLCALALANGIEPDWTREIVRRLRLSPPAGAEVTGWPWRVEVVTTGALEILAAGEAVRPARRAARRPLQLLELLVAAGPGGAVAQAGASDALWPEAEGDAAQHALEMTIHRARKLLGTDDAIVVRDGSVALNARTCRVDAWAFEQAARGALARAATGGDAAPELARALSLYPASFLPGEDAPQVSAYRARLDALAERCRMTFR